MLEEEEEAAAAAVAASCPCWPHGRNLRGGDVFFLNGYDAGGDYYAC